MERMKSNQRKGSVARRQCSAPCSHNKAGLIYSLSRGSSPALSLHWSVRLALLGLLTELFLCSVSFWMPISVFISDWPRWALSLVLLCGACYVILACTTVLDRGLSVQAWPVERGRWEREKASEKGWMHEKNSEWISVPSLFIGWWRATPRVYPWPSYLLISPPSHPPLPTGLQCTLPPTPGHPHPRW